MAVQGGGEPVHWCAIYGGAIAIPGPLVYALSMSLYHRHATARLLVGRPVHLLGRLLTDETRAGDTVAVDPETGAEVKDGRPAFVLSSENEATDGHIVRQFWDLSRAGSVGVPVLWSHDPQQLLGQWEDLRVMDIGGSRSLVGRPMMDPEHPDAQMRLGQIRRGILRAVSVGWQPGEMVRRSSLDERDPAYRAAQEDECGQPAEGFVMGTQAAPNRLVECSLVSVPADDRAMVTERLYERAEAAMGQSLHIRNADLDAMLAALADHPRLNRWLDLRIAAAVRAQAPVAPATIADFFKRSRS